MTLSINIDRNVRLFHSGVRVKLNLFQWMTYLLNSEYTLYMN